MTASVTCSILLATWIAGSGKQEPGVPPPPPEAIASRDAAQAFWQAWASKHKYHFASSRDARVLVMLPQERSKPERALELVERSLARFDEILPLPKREPPPAKRQNGATSTTSAPAWGASDRPLESDTIVMALLRKPSEYASALDLLGQHHGYLRPWIANGKDDPGCILERPLFGACIASFPGMEEWSPDHEIVHRTAQLAMLRRFGQQPVWVGLGVGWNVEFDVLKSIYCFPWRNGFVRVSEHGGWESHLRRLFDDRAKPPLAAADLAAIKRGSFDTDQAALAWGTIRFLVESHPDQLPLLLDELEALRNKLGRVSTDGGKNWTMAAGYVLPAEEQEGAFERVIGAEVFVEAGEAFRNSKKGRAAKK